MKSLSERQNLFRRIFRDHLKIQNDREFGHHQHRWIAGRFLWMKNKHLLFIKWKFHQNNFLYFS